MSIHLFNNLLNLHCFGIEQHFFSVLYQVYQSQVLVASFQRKRIGSHLLNFKANVAFSSLALGNCATEIFIVCRAFGGSNERNMRAALDLGEKGLNFIVTSVRNRGIMVDYGLWIEGVAEREMAGVKGLIL